VSDASNASDFFNDAGKHGLYCSAGVPLASSGASGGPRIQQVTLLIGVFTVSTGGQDAHPTAGGTPALLTPRTDPANILQPQNLRRNGVA
jgi:hypothetical protein